MLKEKQLTTKITVSDKVILQKKTDKDSLKTKSERFITPRHVLQKIMKGDFQAEIKWQ